MNNSGITVKEVIIAVFLIAFKGEKDCTRNEELIEEKSRIKLFISNCINWISASCNYPFISLTEPTTPQGMIGQTRIRNIFVGTEDSAEQFKNKIGKQEPILISEDSENIFVVDNKSEILKHANEISAIIEKVIAEERANGIKRIKLAIFCPQEEKELTNAMLYEVRSLGIELLIP